MIMQPPESVQAIRESPTETVAGRRCHLVSHRAQVFCRWDIGLTPYLYCVYIVILDRSARMGHFGTGGYPFDASDPKG